MREDAKHELKNLFLGDGDCHVPHQSFDINHEPLMASTQLEVLNVFLPLLTDASSQDTSIVQLLGVALRIPLLGRFLSVSRQVPPSVSSSAGFSKARPVNASSHSRS